MIVMTRVIILRWITEHLEHPLSNLNVDFFPSGFSTGTPITKDIETAVRWSCAFTRQCQLALHLLYTF
ncbi:hypothetical protein GDO81_009752 [Engystomops pustulosus]|uniref:Uncharacterized protein n=1 Tax=Engystomops pustulosus TaxID=76066 RepID=A0AAV7BTI0_ENGPU|nr:hypothetical protein GDO81_009752 [Engystomops pustulosus]